MNSNTPSSKRIRIPLQKNALGMQLSLASCVLFLQIGLLAGISAFVLRYFAEMVRISNSLALSENHPFRGFIETQRQELLGDIMLYGGGLVIASTVLMFIFSFRYVGPIQRVIGYLETIRDQKRVSHPIHLRESDYLAPLAQSLNEALQSLSENGKTPKP